MNLREAQTLIAEMAATWPQRQLDEAQVAVWCDTLKGVSIDAGRAGLRRLRESLDFPPSHHELLVASQEEARRLAAHRQIAGEKGPCRECNDDQWVTLGTPAFGAVPTVRPCSRCMPVQFVRWGEGHMAAGHRCSECTDIAKGSAETRRSTLSAIRGRCVAVDLDPVF